MNKMIAKRYMVVKHIGQGGMADVYVAVDTLLNREVAVKVLRGELSNDPVALLRFQREANASTALSHPNIVDIYDVGEENGYHYIVMEYVRGKDLKQLIAQRGALCKEEAVAIMKQLVSAVAEAHRCNIIHRDIKPQNVLIKDDGTLKVVDFGIALAQDALQLERGRDFGHGVGSLSCPGGGARGSRNAPERYLFLGHRVLRAAFRRGAVPWRTGRTDRDEAHARGNPLDPQAQSAAAPGR